MKKKLLQSKSQAFAVRIIKFYKYLCSKDEFVLGKQILKSGTSIGANIRESRNAQSLSDFISKMNIALKEADETEYWLRKLLAGGYIEEKGYQSMHDDNEEIVRILVKIIKTMKQKCKRNG